MLIKHSLVLLFTSVLTSLLAMESQLIRPDHIAEDLQRLQQHPPRTISQSVKDSLNSFFNPKIYFIRYEPPNMWEKMGISNMQFSDDGKSIIAIGNDGDVDIFEKGHWKHKFSGYNCVAAFHSKYNIYARYDDGFVDIYFPFYNIRTFTSRIKLSDCLKNRTLQNSTEQSYAQRNNRVKCMKFNNTGTHLAIGTTNGEVIVIDIRSESVTNSSLLNGPISGLAFNPNDSQLAAWARNKLQIIDIATNTIHTLDHEKYIEHVTFNSKGTEFACSTHQQVAIFNTAHGRISTFFRHPDTVNSALFMHSDKQLVTGSDDSLVRIIDLTTYQIVRSFRFQERVIVTAIKPDDTSIALTFGKAANPFGGIWDRYAKISIINLMHDFKRYAPIHYIILNFLKQQTDQGHPIDIAQCPDLQLYIEKSAKRLRPLMNSMKTYSVLKDFNPTNIDYIARHSFTDLMEKQFIKSKPFILAAIPNPPPPSVLISGYHFYAALGLHALLFNGKLHDKQMHKTTDPSTGQDLSKYSEKVLYFMQSQYSEQSQMSFIGTLAALMQNDARGARMRNLLDQAYDHDHIL